MKTKYIFTSILACLICCSNIAFAQLSLRYYFPMSDKSGKELVGRYDGTVIGNVETFPDRFGNANGAMKFAVGSYVSLPDLLKGFNYRETGFTISFWVYIDEELEKRTGLFPWMPSDDVYRAFFAKEDRVALMGFYRRADRAVIDRYTKKTDGTNIGWPVWIWDPMNFTRRVGWYQIFLCYEKNRTFIYMYYPTGEVQSSAYYFGAQDIPATVKWGLGNDFGNSFIMNDFRFYEGVASYEDTRQLHSQFATPNGMYRIALCADNTKYIDPLSEAVHNGNMLQINTINPKDDLYAYKWVITPVEGKPNVYRIRVAYEDKLMHMTTQYSPYNTAVDIYEFMRDPQYFEWYIQPTGEGYFYIKANRDQSKYLHCAGHSSASGTRLEIMNYDSGYAPLYKWKLELIKTNYEIENGPVEIDHHYEFILSDNTMLGLEIDNPVFTDGVHTYSDRGAYPSRRNFWLFHRIVDDSYRIYSTPHPAYNLYPYNDRVALGTDVMAMPLVSTKSVYYNFVIEKPNKYGRRYIIKHAFNQNLVVAPEDATQGSRLGLRYKSENKPDQWALYDAYLPNTVKLLYFLRPGVYRITSVADPTKSISTYNYQWSTTTGLRLRTTNDARYTSHYWVVDYELDSSGNPVMDGTYTIKLFGTDELVFHPRGNTVASSIQVETFPINRDNIGCEKWFIKPTRAGDDAYYIQNAANQDQYVHLENNSTYENSIIELYSYIDSSANTYRWNFEAVNINAPLATSIYQISTQEDLSKYMHVQGDSTLEGEYIDIRSFITAFTGSYQWEVIRQPDNTYLIKNVASGLYLHPVGNQAVAGVLLQQGKYDAAYAPFFKWIIEPGKASDNYRICIVADPSKYIHLHNNSAEEGNFVELLDYDPTESTTYDWYFQLKD